MCNAINRTRGNDGSSGDGDALPKPDIEKGDHASQPLTAIKAATRKHFPPSGQAVGPTSDAGHGSVHLDSLPQSQQMALLSIAMFLFFGMHNILQEAIVNILSASMATSSNKADGTIMLGYAEVCGVFFFSFLERVFASDESGWERKAPLSSYPLLTACLFASSSLCNMSLSYINFPTKVVFRSCKLVPTMVIATLLNKKTFAGYEYACALAICTGLVLFALADYQLDPIMFDVRGLALVSGSVVADSILPNAQERLFREGSSRLEVTVYSNLFSFLAITVTTTVSGTLGKFAKLLCSDSRIAMYFGLYTVLSYLSISCYMILVKRFGGVAAVLLTTARKAMTLVLSFLLFPKGFSWLYVHGSLLVLGAVMIAGICKKTKRTAAVISYSNPNKDSPKPTSKKSLRSTSEDSSNLPQEAVAILKDISKRSHA